MTKITATITMGSDRQLNLYADNMNELVGKIMELRDLDVNIESMQSSGDYSPNQLEKEKTSGWYYKKDYGR